jgi:S-adenosylhomocysteine hydrolase
MFSEIIKKNFIVSQTGHFSEEIQAKAILKIS